MLRLRERLRAWNRDTKGVGTRGTKGCAKFGIVNQSCNQRDERSSLKRQEQDVRVYLQGMSGQVAELASCTEPRLPRTARFGAQRLAGVGLQPLNWLWPNT